MRSSKERIATFIIGVLAVATFCVLTISALVWANGLQFDPQTLTINQTAVIAVEPELNDVTILINGRVVSNEAPYQERNLPAGKYELIIRKTNFRDYQKIFQLSAGEVGVVKEEAVLLAAEPRRTNLEAVEYRQRNSIDLGLEVNNGEITDQGKLITRLSQDPVLIQRFNGTYVYQVGTELRLFLPENRQDELISNLATSAPAKINLVFNDWRIIIFEGDVAFAIDLILPTVSGSI